jgi:hypothetical protein
VNIFATDRFIIRQTAHGNPFLKRACKFLQSG